MGAGLEFFLPPAHPDSNTLKRGRQDELAPRRVGAPPLPLPLPSREGYVFNPFNLESPARHQQARVKMLDNIMTKEVQARRLREVWLSYGGSLFKLGTVTNIVDYDMRG